MSASTVSRRAARAASNYDVHAESAVSAYWEGLLASEGMPDRLPMIDARRLTPELAATFSPIVADEYSTVATMVAAPTIAHVLRDADGRLTRRVDMARIDTDMAVTVTRGADGRYLRRATLRRLTVDALVTVESVDITAHDSPRSRGAARMVDVMGRGLACTGAALGSDAWTDTGTRYCAVRATDELASVLGEAGEWLTVGVWSRVSVDAWCDARAHVARVKALRRDGRRVQAPSKRAERARSASARPIVAVRLADSGRGLAAARARWEGCTDTERADVADVFGLPVSASWDTVRAHAVASLGKSSASLADAMAVASVGGMAARVG